MKLEYILMFTEDGIPIHSSCYGSFCANMGYNKSLLAGFISALSSMPSAIGHDDIVKSVEMGYSKLMFDHTHPSNHIICLGVVKDTIDEPKTTEQVKAIFAGVEKILEEKFQDQTWVMVKSEDRHRLDEEIIHNVIEKNLTVFRDNDVCDHEGCPFDKISDHDHPIPEDTPNTTWDRARVIYATNGVSWLRRVLAPIVIPIFRFFDIRSYKKEEKQLMSS